MRQQLLPEARQRPRRPPMAIPLRLQLLGEHLHLAARWDRFQTLGRWNTYELMYTQIVSQWGV